jgi:hypothetical protein
MRALAFLALLAGCYAPEIGDCQYLCSGPQRSCPDNMFCSVDGFCVTQQGFNCGIEPPDGPQPPEDTGMPIDAMMPPPPDSGMPTGDATPTKPSELLPVATDSTTTVHETLDDVRR